MTATRSKGKKNALASKTYGVAMCAKWTRTMFGLPATGDVDGDGDVDAVDAWKAAKHRHRADLHPPAGVPVYWGGGSKGHGHAAVSLGGKAADGTGRVRSIDWPRAGVVGTTSVGEINRKWGLPYYGWSEDWAGHEIEVPKSRTLASIVKRLEKSARKNEQLKRHQRADAIRKAITILKAA